MADITSREFALLYARFPSPIARLDCGEKCAPYNENGVPFCCDTRHAVPTAYEAEWEYLRNNTGLWHPWAGESSAETGRLGAQTPPGMVLIACLGHTHCQRSFRSLTCRTFPFFPYIDLQDKFLGLSYYWEYEDRCWVISNLSEVTSQYREEFISAFDQLFERMPQELQNFRYHSIIMRRIFGKQKRAIPLLHRNGNTYKITPSNGRMRRAPVESLPKFGPYRIADVLLFPDEIQVISEPVSQ